MRLQFPSLDFFKALQQRTKDEAAAFEKLGYCDTTFGIRVGDALYRIRFEIYVAMSPFATYSTPFSGSVESHQMPHPVPMPVAGEPSS